MALTIGIFAVGFLFAYLLASSRRREQGRARDAAIAKAAFKAGLEASSATLADPPKPSIANAELRRVMAHKAEIPDLDRRATYWRSPPVSLSSDADVAAAMRRGPVVRIVFTGWTDIEKDALTRMAEGVGLRVLKNGSPYLNLLCVGESPGPVKLEKAAAVGAAVISGAQLERIAAFDPAFPLRPS